MRRELLAQSKLLDHLEEHRDEHTQVCMAVPEAVGPKCFPSLPQLEIPAQLFLPSLGILSAPEFENGTTSLQEVSYLIRREVVQSPIQPDLEYFQGNV